MSIETLKLADIEVDYAIQPRAKGLDQAHVEDLAQSYRDGEDIPRPVVWKVGAAHKLSQGFHRHEGAKRAGLKELECEVHVGTDMECRIDALASNQGHGLKRTPEDIQRAVEQITAICPDWSDRRLAERLHVSPTTVAKYRPRQSEPVQNPVSTVDTGTVQTSERAGGKRKGKDGVEQSATKAKADPPADLDERVAAALKKDPAASDHHISSILECKPAEVKAARKRRDKSGGESAPDAPAEPATEPQPEEHPADAFAGRVGRLCRSLDAAKAEAKELAAEKPHGGHIHAESVTGQIEAARKALWQSRPTEACNCVKGGKPAAAGCKACFGTGRTTPARVLRAGR